MSPKTLAFNRELNQVLFEADGGVRKVILNRPQKLNALTYEMILHMLKKLEIYENDSRVKLVIVKGNGKAFCAGGDVFALITVTVVGHWSFGASFIRKLFAVDYLIGTYQKPVVSLLDGVVMGGGARISMHAGFRVVTENTVFAMPEAAIGLFPDVGASHFLSRLPGYFGEYLGLTGAQLDGTEMLACGLATHFIYSKDLASLESDLSAAGLSDVLDMSTTSRIIDKFAQKVCIKQDSACSRFEIINKCFSKETVEEILSSLENRAEKWITEAIDAMKSASPISLKLFLRSIREGRMHKLDQCFIREYNTTCHVLRGTVTGDFCEGSRAMLFEKDKKPQWEPANLTLVTEEMVSRCFDTVDDDEWVALQLPARSIQTCIAVSKL